MEGGGGGGGRIGMAVMVEAREVLVNITKERNQQCREREERVNQQCKESEERVNQQCRVRRGLTSSVRRE